VAKIYEKATCLIIAKEEEQPEESSGYLLLVFLAQPNLRLSMYIPQPRHAKLRRNIATSLSPRQQEDDCWGVAGK